MGDEQRFNELVDYLKVYESLDLRQMNANFNAYSSKILKDVLPLSKAKFIISRLLIYSTNKSDGTTLILNHPMLKGTGRDIEFCHSKRFQWLVSSSARNFQNPKKGPIIIKNSIGSSMAKRLMQTSIDDQQNLISCKRRMSMESNYNKRTYNQEIVKERFFGTFMVQMAHLNFNQEGD